MRSPPLRPTAPLGFSRLPFTQRLVPQPSPGHAHLKADADVSGGPSYVI